MVKTGKEEGKITQEIKTFFRTNQGVCMTTTQFSSSANTYCRT